MLTDSQRLPAVYRRAAADPDIRWIFHAGSSRPFDRLLVAHAILHGWEIATVDKTVGKYPVRIFS
jgi:hypothetical protein